MRTFFFCLLLLVEVGAAAQVRQPAKPDYTQYQFAVSINPLALLNPDQRIMAGVERRFNNRWGVLAEAGLIISSVYIQDIKKTSGFEIRPALRYYYGRTMDGYVQGQLQYRHVDYQLHDWLGKNCVDGVPAYERLQDFTYRKQNLGAAIVAGGLVKLGKPLLLDVSAGLGLVHRRQRVANEQGACYFPPSDLFSGGLEEETWMPTLPIAVKLVYVIK